jgi:hypothetical protein
VVGCDGGLSKVREQLGLPFTGHDYRMHFILADLQIDWPGAHEEGHYFVRDDGFLILLPLQSGYHRIVIKVEGICAPGYKPDLAQIRHYIERYQVEALCVDAPIWLSSAPFYNRCVTRFRQGRVFLAGDAAHLFSPIGGFGMNTGLGDAFNLGWKLGHYLNGCGTDALLESYHTERHGIAQKLLAETDHSTSLIARLDRHQPRDEEVFLPRMCNRGFARAFPAAASGLSLSYESAEAAQLPAATLRSGRQLPYVVDGEGGGDSLHWLGGGQFCCLLVPAADSGGEQRCRELATHLLQVSHGAVRAIVLAGPQAAADVSLPHAAQQRLRHAFGLDAGSYLLIRPDLHVALCGEIREPAPLWRYLDELLGSGTTLGRELLAS